MIDSKQLAEIQQKFQGLARRYPVQDLLDTLESLWKENAELKDDWERDRVTVLQAIEKLTKLEAVATAAEDQHDKIPELERALAELKGMNEGESLRQGEK